MLLEDRRLGKHAPVQTDGKNVDGNCRNPVKKTALLSGDRTQDMPGNGAERGRAMQPILHNSTHIGNEPYNGLVTGPGNSHGQ